jgi:alpha-tubulin suppressor-like RCC1 family protein
MPISVGNLVSVLNDKINGPDLDPLNTARLVDSVGSIDASFSVQSLVDLPLAADNTGRFIYVIDIEDYRYSDGVNWVNEYDSTPSDFQIWSWGLGSFGQLGDGTTVSKCSPVQEISSSTDWCQVSAGSCISSALKTNGEIWSWGRGICGQLGDGSTVNKCSPVQEISSSTNWCQVSAGSVSAHSSAIKTTGEIWSWGINTFGNLGDGTLVSKCSPVQEITSSTNWCQVSAGGGFSSAIKTTGEIWSWGCNNLGLLGDGTATTRTSPVREISSSTDWCQVSAGFVSSSAIKTTGEIWSWGAGGNGRLGDGTTINKCSPVREISSSTDWCQVSSNNHTSAIKTTGEIWSWGIGSCGRLGDGTTVNKCSPVQEISSSTDWCQVSAGYAHSSALKTNGEIWSWGRGLCGQLGDGSTVNKCSPVQEISSSTNWCQVSAGSCSNSSALKITKGFNAI